jgi:hypothetical protein
MENYSHMHKLEDKNTKFTQPCKALMTLKLSGLFSAHMVPIPHTTFSLKINVFPWNSLECKIS